MSAISKSQIPLKKRILAIERANGAARLQSDTHVKQETSDEKTTLLLTAAQSVNQDLWAASEEDVNRLKQFIAEYMNVPPGEEVRVGAYKGSVWHDIAMLDNNNKLSGALNSVLHRPRNTKDKILFSTRRKDGTVPKFPVSSLLKSKRRYYHVLDVSRAVNDKQTGRRYVYASLGILAEAFKQPLKSARCLSTAKTS